MAERRLDPAQLKARLQATLATEPARGHARPAAFSQLTTIDPGGSIDLAERPEANLAVAQITPRTPVDSGSRMNTMPAPIGPPREAREPKESKDAKKRAVVHRCDAGAVLRGYRIPLALHRRAERAKLEASAKRGATLFWDEVLQAAIDALPTDIRDVARLLTAPSGRAEPNPTTRVLQATIRHDQELMLRRLRLDLEEVFDRTVRLEEIWALLVEQVVDRGL